MDGIAELDANAIASLIRRGEISAEEMASNLVHLERFKAEPLAPAEPSLDSFDVQLASTGQTVHIDAKTSIVDALAAIGSAAPTVSNDRRTLSLSVDDEVGLASRVVTQLASIGVEVDEVALHRPSLDDVFFHLTGHAAETDDTEGEAA